MVVVEANFSVKLEPQAEQKYRKIERKKSIGWVTVSGYALSIGLDS